MTGIEAIRDMLKKQGVTQGELSKRLNISRALVSMRLLQNREKPQGLTETTLAETAEALHYKLVLVPENMLLPITAYHITPPTHTTTTTTPTPTITKKPQKTKKAKKAHDE